MPGSEVKIKIGGMLHSIDKHWRGEIIDVKTKSITVGGKDIEWSFSNVYSQQDKWPRSYSFSHQGAAGNSYPWVAVVIPNDS